jgi:hypothetical protein
VSVYVARPSARINCDVLYGMDHIMFGQTKKIWQIILNELLKKWIWERCTCTQNLERGEGGWDRQGDRTKKKIFNIRRGRTKDG